jgi:hypothetical protein
MKCRLSAGYDRDRMHAARWIVLLAALVAAGPVRGQSAGPPGSRKAPADPAAEAHREAVSGLKAGLLELAGWCQGRMLDRERARLFELVLVYDPDHAAARAALGYVKARGGGWERSSQWKEPGNKDASDLAEFKKKKSEVGGAFLDRMSAIIEEHRRDIDAAHRARMIADMNAVDPNDPRTKRAAGEEQAGGKWVLAETVATPVRRKKLQEIAKAAIAAAGTPRPAETSSDEADLGLKWAAILATSNVRVLGTGSKDEVARVAVLTDAAGELFRKAFDSSVTHPFAMTYYLLADANDKTTFLRNDRRLNDENRRHAQTLGSTWIGRTNLAHWGPDATQRTDSAVRQTMGTFTSSNFGITTEQGALYEGLGLHLSWYLTGTRLTWTVGKRKYAQSGADGLMEKLRKPGTDWIKDGIELVASRKGPPLKALLAKHVNDLEPEDMLFSYALAVWLIDGCERDAERFLRYAGRKTVDEGAREAFGTDLNGLEERFIRWAKEMRGS